MSEEFGGALPSAIWAEQQRLPPGFLEQVIEYRSYAQAKAAVEAATTREAIRQLPDTDMIRIAKEIELEIAEDAMTKSREKPVE